jgi:hypothetical protein
MTWQLRQFSDGSGTPWQEWELPHGMSYAVESKGRGYVASLVDSGGAVLWSRRHKSEGAAKEACRTHAFDLANELMAVGEGSE